MTYDCAYSYYLYLGGLEIQCLNILIKWSRELKKKQDKKKASYVFS